MISLTDNAARHLRHLLEQKNAPATSGLRVRVEKGGCAGWQYTMKVDEAEPADQVFQNDGVFLIVDPESLTFLNNSQIDYVEALNDSGFRVENPNAARNCGCGTSFEPKAD
jgi:iron-sulfur cluster assembly accessory protein